MAILHHSNGYYHIIDGHILEGEHNRELHLPMNTYNMVYWGTPKYEEPIYDTPAIHTPGFSIGVDFILSLLQFYGATMTGLTALYMTSYML